MAATAVPATTKFFISSSLFVCDGSISDGPRFPSYWPHFAGIGPKSSSRRRPNCRVVPGARYLRPATIACIFPNATSRGRYFMPQSGAMTMRSAGTCGSALRMRPATISGVSTFMSERSITPRIIVFEGSFSRTLRSSLGLRRLDRDLRGLRAFQFGAEMNNRRGLSCTTAA